jgi:hypothetical protein
MKTCPQLHRIVTSDLLSGICLISLSGFTPFLIADKPETLHAQASTRITMISRSLASWHRAGDSRAAAFPSGIEGSPDAPALVLATTTLDSRGGEVVIFLSFRLFAQSSPMVIGELIIFALSATGAIYLILELSQPFGGLMQIPSAVRHRV